MSEDLFLQNMDYSKNAEAEKFEMRSDLSLWGKKGYSHTFKDKLYKFDMWCVSVLYY